MPLYTFYPCRIDEASLSFEAYELPDDADANARAIEVLTQHPSAEFVVVWCGERKVLTQYRSGPGKQVEAPALTIGLPPGYD